MQVPVPAVSAEGTAQFLAADFAHVKVYADSHEPGQRLVRGAVKVRAPLDRDLPGAARLVRFLEILDWLHSNHQDGSAFIARLTS